MPVSDSQIEFAKLMQQRHAALLELTRMLKEHIVKQPGIACEDWLHGLNVAFKRLHKHLEESYEAKSAGGYLEHVLELRPNLSSQVERIRHEHDELLKMSGWIERELDEVTCADRVLIADCTARIQRFMAIATQHNQQESMLTMLVFNQDLGGFD
jgi:hemerythrin-like domain-containing protein